MTELPSSPKRTDVARSVVFSLRVLELVAATQPVALGDLARALDSPKTTVLRALRALAVAGYVFQETAPPRWSLTLRCLRLAEAATSALSLTDAALPVMTELSAVTEETVSLGVLEDDKVVVAAKVDGRKAVRAYTERGATLPIHASSSGKVLLALDKDLAETILARPLERFTDSTITDPGDLRRELDLIRTQGFAVNRGERRTDVLGVAAPIRDSTEKAVAALSIALPRQYAAQDAVDILSQHCVAAADALSHRLGS